MRAIAVTVLVVGMMIAGSIAWPAGAQDSTGDRVTELETRVAEIESDVADLQTAVAAPEREVPESADSTETHSLMGRVELIDTDAAIATDRPCRGRGGYDDIREGAQVMVLNESNQPIAKGRLGEGVGQPYSVCTFPFVVRDVPAAQFYTIEIANRGGPTFSPDELDQQAWMVVLTIGSYR